MRLLKEPPARSYLPCAAGIHPMKSARQLVIALLFLVPGPFIRLVTAAPGDVDTLNVPVNGQVQAFALQPDGKIIIGGQFNSVQGVARSKIARLNADGT